VKVIGVGIDRHTILSRTL